jgi:hypothetical protein
MAVVLRAGPLMDKTMRALFLNLYSHKEALYRSMIRKCQKEAKWQLKK